jgi:outer membrane protein with beta-barrel domain
MRRAALGFVAFWVTLAATAAPVTAQKKDIKARGYLGIGGGLAIPVGNYGDEAKTGWLANLIGGFTTKGGIFGGRADLMWAQNGIVNAAGHERLLGLNADLVLTPGHRPANFHPYFLAGVGVFNARQSTTGVTGSETKLAINTGVGVQIHTGHRTDVFLEGRFISIRANSALNLIPITLGLRWGGI